ncbi:hypothetical protein, partial [Arthrobacter sp. H14]|uniref:hypothetical protein n=1 Tax=Arthrobacter sp. H14 TaxID=1312959 RepID=UPI000479DF03
MDAGEDLVRGFRSSPAVERVVFGMTLSFSVTVAASRVLNYVRERRRFMPRVRSFGRTLAMIPYNNRLRIHHFVPGTAIAFTVGCVALVLHPSRANQWWSVPFGAGVAMTVDELPVMTGRNNPYWGEERYALMLYVTGTVAVSGLLAVFLR